MKGRVILATLFSNNAGGSGLVGKRGRSIHSMAAAPLQQLDIHENTR